MALGLGKGVAFSKYSGVVGGGGPTTRASITALNANGWTANDNTPITYDPVGDPQYVISLDAGFDGSGNAATITRNLLIRKRLRQAYPSQASLTSNTAVIGDYIYATSNIVGFTNNSTLAAPKPGAMWLNRDRETVTSATSGVYTARLAVAHPYARSGRPVASVKFFATDGTTTVDSGFISAMSTISYSAGGLSIPHFAGSLNFATLTQGASITVWAIIYPWVGAAFDISTDADTYPSPNLTTLRVLNDRTDGYGKAYAYVDSVNGNNATGVTSTTRATAIANPYLSVAGAAAAIKTYNNANLGRNCSDGGVVLLKEGSTTVTFTIQTTASTINWPLTIEAEDPTKAATTFFGDNGTSIPNSMPSKLVLRNLTIRRNTTGSITMLDNSAASLSYTNMMAFENCIGDSGGFAAYNGFIFKTGVMYATNCSGPYFGQVGITGTVNKAVKSVGCSSGWANSQTCFGMLGCSGGSMINLPATSARVAGAGQFCGWCFITAGSDGGPMVSSNDVIGARGFFMIGTVIERLVGNTTPLVQINADSDLNTTQNVVVQCNTIVGARMNHQYQDLGSTTIAKSGYFQYNVITSGFNTKTDIFPNPTSDGNRVGNWPAAFHVGYKYNAYLRGDNNANSTPGTGNWIGELFNEGEVSGSTGTPLTANFVADKSLLGTNVGGGDYRPQTGHQFPLIPAGQAPYSYDHRGTAIANDGTAVVGALQI